MTTIDVDQAEQTLMELLAVEGLSGKEGAIAAAIAEQLKACGVPADAIRHDDAHTRIPGYTVGNLLVSLPGTRPGPGRLFSTHMDTVPLCAGAVARREGDRIVSEGETALGGDNRTGCGALVTLARTLLAGDYDYPPLLLMFTVGEEQGLFGARQCRAEDMAGLEMGFNIDGDGPASFVRGAIGMQVWRAELEGIASHAGVHPHRGVSAAMISALAMAEMRASGYFGRVEQDGGRGTTNVGRVEGGAATNEVTRQMTITGECRSHDAAFVQQISDRWQAAFERAAAEVTNHEGQGGKASFEILDQLPAYALPEDAPVCQVAAKAAQAAGLEATFEICDGGLDASFLSLHVPTITFGAGQHDPHSIDEYIDLQEYRDGCRMAVQLAIS